MSDILKVTNRRDSSRRLPRGHIGVELHLGKYGMGPNAADALLDLSQNGACLAVKSEFPLNADVELVLISVCQHRPIRIKTTVIRVDLEPDGRSTVGLHFETPLPYALWQQLTQEPVAGTHAANSPKSGASLSSASPVRSPAES